MHTTNELELAGCRLHWSRNGEGAAVLFLQGVGVHGDGWSPQIDDLVRDHDCLWFDNRGIGRSQSRGDRVTIERMAHDAIAVLDAANVTAAHVVGHSLGGLVAQQMALLAPQRVRSLALLCTFCNGRTAARGSRMFWLGMRTSIDTKRMRRHAFLEIVLPPAMLIGGDRDALAAQLEPVFGHDLAHRPRGSMAQIAAFRRCDLTDGLPALDGIPTLVVSAAHDVIAPPRHGRQIAAAIRGAQHVELADAAHGAPITHAARVNELLRAHFAAARLT